MKKYLSVSILIVFVLSILGSVSPGFKAQVMKLTGGQKYASTFLPVPPERTSAINLADQNEVTSFEKSLSSNK